jgi:KDO2-lipid IV(A) lauroyltransferase
VISRQRESLYLGGLFPKNKQTARTALRHVRNGGVISIMADLRDKSGVLAPFFGREAPSTPFPALLAVALGKKLLIGQVIRDPGVRFRVKLEEVDVARTGSRETNIAATTVLIQSKIENFVREYPDQWMWSNRRWG